MIDVGILLFDGADEMDVIGPARVFWALEEVRPFFPDLPPVRVHLVSEEAGPVRCGNGATLLADTDYASAPPLRVLVVPGGGGPAEDTGRRKHMAHEPTLAFVRRQAEGAEVVASVCTGAFVLAGAGLLAGRRATTHWFNRQALVDFMAERGEPFELVADRVVDEGDVVSGGGVLSGIDVGFHLVERLLGPDVRAAAELAIEVETPEAAPAAPSTA